tara:strand:+ start:241 stop:522 length:282 start_codon:yes stop_codon:yes gene_type:complete
MKSHYETVGRGYLTKNKFKKKDNEPFFKGKATVNNKEVNIAGWIKQKDGGQIISLSFDVETKPESAPQQNNGGALEDLFSDNVKGNPKKLPFE